MPGLVSFALSALVCATFLVWLTKRCLDVSGWRQCETQTDFAFVS